MADKVYKVIELVGSSEEGLEEAMRSAVNRASQTLRGLDWVEVGQIRGRIENAEITEFQVEMKIGFRLM